MKLSIYIIISMLNKAIFADNNPCAAQLVPNQSVVCVCDESYCDDFIREAPEEDSYVAYISSESGLRFHKTRGKWSLNGACQPSSMSLILDTCTTYQTIEGFGGAVTDSAGINWRSLPPVAQDHLINSYFSEKGLEYNMLRVPIGGCDFSTHAYAYNELPVNDTKLTNYTLAPEDFMYKIPMIKSIMKAATTDVKIVATTWSPSIWMKTPQTYGGYNHLLLEYYQTYADYYLKLKTRDQFLYITVYCKELLRLNKENMFIYRYPDLPRFLEKYKEFGIFVWGITTTNEPIDGKLGFIPFNCLGWDVDGMATWIINNLGPTIRNSEFNDTKIIIGDDQRLFLPYWYNLMVSIFPKVLEYVDGIGVHYYTDSFVSPLVFNSITRSNPEIFILATEASQGSFPGETAVVLGSWERAKAYILDILEDLNYNLVGWIDWNLCLDLQGGPNWVENYVDSAILVDKEKQLFYKQPMFYAMGHFSKLVQRGSIRIKVIESTSPRSSNISHVAFITPRNTIVVIIYNDDDDTSITLKYGRQQTCLFLVAKSVTTIEFPRE